MIIKRSQIIEAAKALGLDPNALTQVTMSANEVHAEYNTRCSPQYLKANGLGLHDVPEEEVDEADTYLKWNRIIKVEDDTEDAQ